MKWAARITNPHTQRFRITPDSNPDNSNTVVLITAGYYHVFSEGWFSLYFQPSQVPVLA